MTKQTFAAILTWIGFAAYAYLSWHFPFGRPTDLTSYIAVGAWVSGGIILLGELGHVVLREAHADGEARLIGGGFVLGACATAIGLMYRSVTTGQVEMVLALLFGAGLYMVLLRLPFMAAMRG